MRLFLEANGRIDLVILDLIMPGMNGVELYTRLKALDSTVKVLLSTGQGLSSTATHMLAQGCNGYILKPFSLQEIARKIRAVLQ